MVNITINGKDFKIKDNWFEITIQDALEIEKLEIPKKLRELYMAETQEKYDKFAKNQDNNIMFFKDVISILGDVPKELLEKTQFGIEQFYHSYLEPFTIGIIRCEPLGIEQRGQKFVVLDKIKYMFPVDKEILNDTRLMADETVSSVIEALDVNANKLGIQGLLALCAIFLRPEGELYTEENALDRINKFKFLPMFTVFEVFFCLGNLQKELQNNTHPSLEKVVVERKLVLKPT